MKILAAILTVIAVISTCAMVGTFAYLVQGRLSMAALLLLAPQWLPTMALDVACVAIWRMIRKNSVSNA